MASELVGYQLPGYLINITEMGRVELFSPSDDIITLAAMNIFEKNFGQIRYMVKRADGHIAAETDYLYKNYMSYGVVSK